MYSNGSNTQFQDKHNDFDVGLYFFTIKYHKVKVNQPFILFACYFGQEITQVCAFAQFYSANILNTLEHSVLEVCLCHHNGYGNLLFKVDTSF